MIEWYEIRAFQKVRDNQPSNSHAEDYTTGSFGENPAIVNTGTQRYPDITMF